MTVSTTVRKQGFLLDGASDEFTFTFRALPDVPTDIKCISSTGGTETILVYSTDYTVEVSTNGVGGTVTLVDPAAVGFGDLIVYRETTETQEADYSDYNQFPAETLEESLDKLTMLVQELLEDISRTAAVPIGSTGIDTNLPTPEANKYLGWNATADKLENKTVDLTIASQAEAEGKVENTRFMTSLRVAQQFAVSNQIINPTPSLDHSVSGNTISLKANENQVFGDVCYINSDGEATLANAAAIATCNAFLMCADATIDANATGTYLLFGIARHDAWNWTVGSLIYVDVGGTSQATLTHTPPTGTDNVIQIVGVATHADRMYFNPCLASVEHT